MLLLNPSGVEWVKLDAEAGEQAGLSPRAVYGAAFTRVVCVRERERE
jgi:hypothetical protein